jgi:Leucine-rich repeat (LRR) protein
VFYTTFILTFQLDNNQIHRLHVSIFRSLVNLTSLSVCFILRILVLIIKLNGNRILRVSFKHFRRLVNLRSLTVSFLELTSFNVPEFPAPFQSNSFNSVKSFQEINKSRSFGCMLSDSVDYSNHQLPNNKISHLPTNAFRTLTNLTGLYVCIIILSSLLIYCFIFLLYCYYLVFIFFLLIIKLDGNQITQLPAGIFDTLTNLTGLYVCAIVFYASRLMRLVRLQ